VIFQTDLTSSRTGKLKAVGSIPTAVKQTFQLARCGHTENNITNINFSVFAMRGNILSTLINLNNQGAIIRVLTLLSGTSLFSATYHVGTRNSFYLRTYFLLVSHDLSKSKVFNTVI
jgi:hypothetical protein